MGKTKTWHLSLQAITANEIGLAFVAAFEKRQADNRSQINNKKMKLHTTAK